MRVITLVALSLMLTLPAKSDAANQSNEAERDAVLAVCHDYIDGQLAGDPARVARSLHPDLAKRATLGQTEDERFGLRRMSKDELVGLTKRGALKTPIEEWSRSCRILDISGTSAAVRLETPWFVDQFHMGNFEGRWLIVNALWFNK